MTDCSWRAGGWGREHTRPRLWEGIQRVRGCDFARDEGVCPPEIELLVALTGNWLVPKHLQFGTGYQFRSMATPPSWIISAGQWGRWRWGVACLVGL